jgi:hypothetical protein
MKILPLLALASALSIGCGPAPPASSSDAPPAASDEVAAPAGPQEPGQISSGTAPMNWTRTFDEDAVDAPPPGFLFGRAGGGRPGQWLVRADSCAPSGGNVLAQLDTDATNNRYPVAVLDALSLQDVRVSVRCKAVSGKVDQACGLVARYRDENNYFVTRANALEDNVRLYVMKNGNRREIASWSGTVTPNAWHTLQLEVQGDRLQVSWDGQRVIDHRDRTFADAGRVGLWTKADSVTYFDDLRADAL